MPQEPGRTPHYRFQELDDGVWAGIAQMGGAGVSNAAVLDLGGDRLVFDPGLTPTSARDLAAWSEARLRGPPTLAANSHWHLDHFLGNQVFEKIPIWATRRTREIMLASQDERKAELTRENLERDLRELSERRDRAPTEAARRELEWFLGMNRSILESLDGLRVVIPDRTFETRLELPGTRGGQLLSFGAGHTEADALLFLPRERIAYAGDLVCVGVQPSMQSGDPIHWLAVLDEIDRLGAERVVPGHGPVGGTDGVEEARGYLTGVLRAAEAPEGRPLPKALEPWEGSLGLEENLKFTRTWLARRSSA